MAYMIRVNSFTDSRGSLSVIEKILPFEIKRIYYIYGVTSTKIIRAGHRHKKTVQALICVSGSCVISNNDGNKCEEFQLISPDQCLILEPKDWHTMSGFTNNSVLLVLASEYYDKDDYIEESY